MKNKPIYGVLIVVGVILAYMATLCADCKYSSLALNLGCGIVTSTIVGLLIDWGNWQIKKQQDKEHMESLQAELERSFASLAETAMYCTIGEDGDSETKRPFASWVQMAIHWNGTTDNDVIWALNQEIIKIQDLACCLLGYLSVLPGLEGNTEEKRDNLKKLIDEAKRAVSSCAKKQYDQFETNLSTKLASCISKVTSCHKHYYTDNYCDE